SIYVPYAVTAVRWRIARRARSTLVSSLLVPCIVVNTSRLMYHVSHVPAPPLPASVCRWRPRVANLPSTYGLTLVSCAPRACAALTRAPEVTRPCPRRETLCHMAGSPHAAPRRCRSQPRCLRSRSSRWRCTRTHAGAPEPAALGPAPGPCLLPPQDT